MSFRIILIACFVLCASCTMRRSERTDDEETRNITLVKKLYEHFNNHDWNAMAALYSDPAEFKDPSFGQDVVRQTRAEIESKYRELEAVFPDVRDDILSVYPSGRNHVIVEFVSSGGSDSTRWTLPICTIFTIENGKITKDYTYYDNSN